MEHTWRYSYTIKTQTSICHSKLIIGYLIALKVSSLNNVSIPKRCIFMDVPTALQTSVSQTLSKETQASLWAVGRVCLSTVCVRVCVCGCMYVCSSVLHLHLWFLLFVCFCLWFFNLLASLTIVSVMSPFVPENPFPRHFSIMVKTYQHPVLPKFYISV